jgi:hypothetical protein
MMQRLAVAFKASTVSLLKGQCKMMIALTGARLGHYFQGTSPMYGMRARGLPW